MTNSTSQATAVPATAVSADLSADGRYFSYTMTVGGTQIHYVVDLATGNTTTAAATDVARYGSARSNVSHGPGTD